MYAHCKNTAQIPLMHHTDDDDKPYEVIQAFWTHNSQVIKTDSLNCHCSPALCIVWLFKGALCCHFESTR